MLFRDDTNEGSVFVSNAASAADFASFFMDQYPQLSSADTDAILALYPVEPPLPKHAAFFPSLSTAYGETTFTCPGLEISAALAKSTKSWNYR